MEIKYSISLTVQFEREENVRREDVSHLISYCKMYEITNSPHFLRERDLESKEVKYEYLSEFCIYFNHKNYEEHHEKLIEMIGLIGKNTNEDEPVPF